MGVLQDEDSIKNFTAFLIGPLVYQFVHIRNVTIRCTVEFLLLSSCGTNNFYTKLKGSKQITDWQRDLLNLECISLNVCNVQLPSPWNLITLHCDLGVDNIRNGFH